MSDTPRLDAAQPEDVLRAATLVAHGVPVAHGFGNIYALTTRGDHVARLNALKGRPVGQTGSVTAPTGHVLDAFDLSALPTCVSASLVRDVVDAFGAIGPFGFRAPAAAHVPLGLVTRDGSTATTQVIVPGDGCPSQEFLVAAAEASGDIPLGISSANRSRHVTGEVDAPVHWRADGLRADFHGTGLVVLEHDEEAAARRFGRHAPTSTTIIAFHHAERVHGRTSLVLERHGSLPVDDVVAVLRSLGLGLTIGAAATVRLVPRSYDVLVG
jgi:hypothetical protein